MRNTATYRFTGLRHACMLEWTAKQTQSTKLEVICGHEFLKQWKHSKIFSPGRVGAVSFFWHHSPPSVFPFHFLHPPAHPAANLRQARVWGEFQWLACESTHIAMFLLSWAANTYTLAHARVRECTPTFVLLLHTCLKLHWLYSFPSHSPSDIYT